MVLEKCYISAISFIWDWSIIRFFLISFKMEQKVEREEACKQASKIYYNYFRIQVQQPARGGGKQLNLKDVKWPSLTKC